MGSGNNYDETHAESVRYIENHLRGSNLDEITWTSEPTLWEDDAEQVHNCFGFALGSKRFWQPPSIHGDFEGDPRFYWPPDLLGDAADNTWVHRYVEAAKTMGFSECDSGATWEEGFEKIVLIHSGGVFTHASLQVSDKDWRSKLGELSDFQHSLEFVLRNPFGKGTVFMKRPRAIATAAKNSPSHQTSSDAKTQSGAAEESTTR